MASPPSSQRQERDNKVKSGRQKADDSKQKDRTVTSKGELLEGLTSLMTDLKELGERSKENIHYFSEKSEGGWWSKT